MEWYIQVLRKYAVFSGRAGRKEYWYFVLFNLIIVIVLGLVEAFTGLEVEGAGILSSIYALAVLIPSIAVGVRRLHDTGRTGWWILIGLIPLIGTIILIIFFVQDGQPRENQYGPNPKGLPPEGAQGLS